MSHEARIEQIRGRLNRSYRQHVEQDTLDNARELDDALYLLERVEKLEAEREEMLKHFARTGNLGPDWLRSLMLGIRS